MLLVDRLKIKHYRILSGLTQKQVADMSGLLPETIRKYELGKIEPKCDNLLKIAKALNVNPRLLMTHEFQETVYPYAEKKRLCDYSTKELLQEIERRCEVGI